MAAGRVLKSAGNVLGNEGLRNRNTDVNSGDIIAPCGAASATE